MAVDRQSMSKEERLKWNRSESQKGQRDLLRLSRYPSLDKCEQWMDEGAAEATDGCRVEPDGHCPHGKASWLLVMGLI